MSSIIIEVLIEVLSVVLIYSYRDKLIENNIIISMCIAHSVLFIGINLLEIYLYDKPILNIDGEVRNLYIFIISILLIGAGIVFMAIVNYLINMAKKDDAVKLNNVNAFVVRHSKIIFVLPILVSILIAVVFFDPRFGINR